MGNEERIRILNMVKEGTISLEEADQLLHSMEEADSPPSMAKGKGKFLRIRIKSDDDEKVNVNVPLSVARWALTMVPNNVKKKLQSGEHPIELEDILQHLHEGMDGERLVDIKDEDGNIVEIYVD